MIRTLSLCLLAILLATPAGATPKRLAFGIPTGTSAGVASDVVTAAYARLGIEATGNPMPARRSLEEANSGNSDGEIARIADIEDMYANLIRIPIPVDYFTISVITLNPGFSIHSLDDIRDLKVGIRAGLQFAEKATADMPNVYTRRDWDDLFNMLRLGRIDAVLATPQVWLNQKTRPGLGKILLHDPQLKPVPLYHYLNRKHADLVPEITAILKQMRDTGKIKAIRDAALLPR